MQLALRRVERRTSPLLAPGVRRCRTRHRTNSPAPRPYSRQQFVQRTGVRPRRHLSTRSARNVTPSSASTSHCDVRTRPRPPADFCGRSEQSSIRSSWSTPRSTRATPVPEGGHLTFRCPGRGATKGPCAQSPSAARAGHHLPSGKRHGLCG